MPIFDNLKYAWDAIRGKAGGPPTGGTGGQYGGGPLFSDPFKFRRSPSPAELVENYKALIYVCANLNSNAVSRGTLRLFATTKGGQLRLKCAVKSVSRHTKARIARLEYAAKMLAGAEDIEEVTDHPILTALKSGNGELDETQILQYTSLSLDIVGSAYWWPECKAGPIPKAFWALPPQNVYPVFNGQSMVPDRYQFGSLYYAPQELLRFRRLSMKNPYGQGYAPAQACIEYARLEESYVNIQEGMLANGPRPDVVVSLKDGKDAFGAAERQRFEHSLNQKGRGGRAGGVFVVDAAVQMSPMSYSPTDLAGLELSKYDMERCANAFDVPISMLTDESSNKANSQTGIEKHARNAVEPRQKIIAAALTRYTHGIGQSIRENSGYERLLWVFDSVVPEEKQAEAELHKSYVDMGVVTRNEVRSEIGYPDDPDGDVLLVPNSLVPLGHAIKPPEPPVMPGQEPGDNPEDEEKPEPTAEDDQKAIVALLDEIKGLL